MEIIEALVPAKKKLSIRKTLLPIAVIVAFLGVSGAAGYFYWQTVQLKKAASAGSAEETARQVQETVAKVSRLVLLPEGETPTMASVSDPSLLKTQPFFDKAQKGDQVLIYSKAKQAILYRPSEDKVINFAPINITAPAADPTIANVPTNQAGGTNKQK